MADSKQVIALQFNNGDENLAELDPTYGVLGAYYSNSRGDIANSLPPVRCDYDKHFAQANLSESQEEVYKSIAGRFTCFEGMDQVELSGLFPGREASFVAIAIDYCQQDQLEEGQECVDR